MVAGVSGALRRDIGVQVDHALRRWLIWTVRAGYGLDDYVGNPCTCTNGEDATKRLSPGTALTYKFSRESLAQGRVPLRPVALQHSGTDYSANVFLVGLKMQR